MILSLEVSYPGVEALLKKFNASLDPDDLADEATAIILNRIRTRFLAEQGPEGKWPPSKAGLKRRASGGTGTLFDTGRLWHSLQAVRTNPGERSIQTDVYYAKHATYEGKRTFLYFTDADVDVVHRLILRRILEAQQ